MNEKAKNKLLKITYITGAVAFISGGIDAYIQQKLLLGLLLIFAGVINVFMILTFNYKRELTGVAAYGLNIVTAVVISINYFQSGSKFIQYAWILLAVLTIIALIIQLNKMSQEKSNKSKE